MTILSDPNFWDGFRAGRFKLIMTHYLYYIGLIGCAVLGIWLLIKIFASPIKGILKFLLHALLGYLILFAVNFIGGFFNFYIPLNWLTAILAGVGGIPGVLLLILIQLLF